MPKISFISQGYEILGCFDGTDGAEDFIASAARTCYRSEPKDPDANDRLVHLLVLTGHHAMIEHSFLSVRFTTDRAIATELVRHRHFSFAQESTRYVNSSRRGFEFIVPPSFEGQGLMGGHKFDCVKRACASSAEMYEELIECGEAPETARSVLPLCTATRIVCSGNFREWMHMLKLRTAPNAHPQMRALMVPLLEELSARFPNVFGGVI